MIHEINGNLLEMHRGYHGGKMDKIKNKKTSAIVNQEM